MRGRAGRQGDPGQTRFFVSLEDDLVHRHGIGALITSPPDASSGAPLDHPRFGRTIAHLQRVIEGESFEIRRTLRKYSFCLERQRRLMHERRQRQMGPDSPTLLRKSNPALFEKLAGEFGDEVVRKVERQITLCQIDRCWSDHLAHVAEIREGNYLISMGGLNAFDEFNRQINEAFRDLLRRMDEEVLATLRTARITADGVDLEREGLLAPSSTWTYMLNDNPLGGKSYLFSQLQLAAMSIVASMS